MTPPFRCAPRRYSWMPAPGVRQPGLAWHFLPETTSDSNRPKEIFRKPPRATGGNLPTYPCRAQQMVKTPAGVALQADAPQRTLADRAPDPAGEALRGS